MPLPILAHRKQSWSAYYDRLQGSDGEAGSWGHEYVRNLAGEISSEFQQRQEDDADVKDLLDLVSQIVPYHMSHNAEPDAVDLLLEVEKLEWLAQYIDDKNYNRTCLYLVSCCAYLAEPDDTAVLRTAYSLYIQCKKYVDAMRIALRMNNHDLIKSTMTDCPDVLHKKQLAFLLARQGILLTYEDEEDPADESAQVPDSFMCDGMSEINLHKLAQPKLCVQHSLLGFVELALATPSCTPAQTFSVFTAGAVGKHWLTVRQPLAAT